MCRAFTDAENIFVEHYRDDDTGLNLYHVPTNGPEIYGAFMIRKFKLIYKC